MDIWHPDADPATARIEGELTDLLATFLYRVHLGAHEQLGLPKLPAEQVRAAYQTVKLPLAKADGINRAQRLFENLLRQPKRARTAEDMAEALTQHWYERGKLESEAQRLVTRANLQGRIEAAGKPQGELDAFEEDPAVLYARARAAIHVTRLRDTTRTLVAGAVVDALLRGDQPAQLAQTLVTQFGTLNRDARRLAITEIAFARNNGFLSTCKVGDEVKWFTAAGCCAHCARLDGRRFKVVEGVGDPMTEVWVGKHNVGIPSDQRMPAIPLHPNCRCRWLKVMEAAPAGVSQHMKNVLDDILGEE